MADAQRQNWTAEQYFASPAVSRSTLWEFDESAKLYHGRHVAGVISPRRETADMRLGTLTHLRVLEPEEYARRVVVQPESDDDFKGAGAKKRREAWKAELARWREAQPVDAVIADPEHLPLVERMRESILAHPRARAIVESGEREVSLTWTDTDELLAAPMPCRARLDSLVVRRTGALIGDLKTTDDPSPDAFARHGARFGYHWQPAFYCPPVMELLGVVPIFCFVVVRNKPPFEVVVYEVDRADIEAAAKQVRRALRRLSKCMATDSWASSWESPAATKLKFPVWAMQEDYHR